MRFVKQTKSNKLYSFISFVAIFAWIIHFLKKITPQDYENYKMLGENDPIEDSFEELTIEKMQDEKFMTKFLSEKLIQFESFLLNHKEDESCYLCGKTKNHIININGNQFSHSKTSLNGNCIHVLKSIESEVQE